MKITPHLIARVLVFATFAHFIWRHDWMSLVATVAGMAAFVLGEVIRVFDLEADSTRLLRTVQSDLEKVVATQNEMTKAQMAADHRMTQIEARTQKTEFRLFNNK